MEAGFFSIARSAQGNLVVFRVRKTGRRYVARVRTDYRLFRSFRSSRELADVFASHGVQSVLVDGDLRFRQDLLAIVRKAAGRTSTKVVGL